jgi:hypothetical protein
VPYPDRSIFGTATPEADEAWVRRVPGASLWVYYTFTEDELTVWSLNNREPIRTD